MEADKPILKQRAAGKDKPRGGKKQKINTTDVDAHIVEQANEEKNPAY
jgi:hypothetical protein